MLRYTITPDAAHHAWDVALTLPAPAAPRLRLVMPTWTPGSYVLREYSGRISEVRAWCAGEPLELEQIGKAEWMLDLTEAPDASMIEIHWRAFAFSTGIHDAWLDHDRGFINPPAVLLHPAGRTTEALDVEVAFRAPGWRVHTALDPAEGESVWRARSLDELFDSPFVLTPESGAGAVIWTLEACGVPHDIVITGTGSLNRERIGRDLKRIFETAAAFWDPEAAKPPFRRYMLAMHLGPGLYGGLEHAAGTMLLEDPQTLPAAGEAEPPKRYDEFLVLAAHEYFHAWLVKRLKPAAFLPYDLSRETYTHDLWIFEGFTSYFESVIARRAGVISEEAYRRHFAERMNFALGREGFDAMSLAESSFNAWVKLYRQTEDSAYTQISYYTKGALAALIINRALLERSGGGVSLEGFLARWFAGVRGAVAAGRWPGLADGALGDVIAETTGVDLRALIATLVHERDGRRFWVKEVEASLAAEGLKSEPDPEAPAALRIAGITCRREAGRVVAGYVPSRSPAFAAGLFAGDEIIAVAGERTTPEGFARQIERARGRRVEIHYFRGPRLLSGTLDLAAAPDPAFLELLPRRIVPLDQKSGS